MIRRIVYSRILRSINGMETDKDTTFNRHYKPVRTGYRFRRTNKFSTATVAGIGRRSVFIFAILLLSAPGRVAAQQRASVGFWNVENLYDTIPSLFYDDMSYTPGGRLAWNTERYETKLSNLSRVIGDAGFDVLGLAEVENEGVVRDLVNILADDYNYVHFTSGDRRGIDLALLYKGDKFFPERAALINSGATREFLHVKGELIGEKVNILVCHLPSKSSSREYRERAMGRLAAVADSLRKNGVAKLIVMGDFNCGPGERLFRKTFGRRSGGFFTGQMLYGAVDTGRGTGSYAWDDKWMLFDNILLSMPFVYGEGLMFEHGGVFVRAYMLSDEAGRRRGYPLRTFSSGRYTAGYSDHLPVYAVFFRSGQ